MKNQTNQKDPNNRGQNGFEYISPEIYATWLGWRDSSHVPRPRDFTIANIVRIGKSPCELPPAVLTPNAHSELRVPSVQD